MKHMTDCTYPDQPQTIQDWIRELRGRCDKATPGPWSVSGNDDDGKGQFIVYSTEAHSGTDEEDYEHSQICQMNDASYGYACNYHKNSEFIAHARMDLPTALKVIEKLIEQRNILLHKHAVAIANYDDELLKIVRGEE